MNWAAVLPDFFRRPLALEIASSLPFVEERCARCSRRGHHSLIVRTTLEVGRPSAPDVVIVFKISSS